MIRTGGHSLLLNSTHVIPRSQKQSKQLSDEDRVAADKAIADYSNALAKHK
jgi:hypothetical protein